MRDLIIIGGLPEPLGGVTTFLKRYSIREASRVRAFWDIYPGNKQRIAPELAPYYRELGGKASLVAKFWRHFFCGSEATVFFNFSTPRSVLLFFLLPKPKRQRWRLMLHHGRLSLPGVIPKWAARCAMLRLDEIEYLSEAQHRFYVELGIPPERLHAGTSYVPPVDHIDDPNALMEVARLKQDYEKLVIMSGFPTEIYNFEKGIEAIRLLDDPRIALCLFIYGPGPLRARLRKTAEREKWIRLFDGCDERYFNTFLRNSDLLLRLNSVDSLGIAVADAVHWGIPVIASDVCPRPAPARLISTECECQDIADVVSEHLSFEG